MIAKHQDDIDVDKDQEKVVRGNLKLLMEPFLHFHLHLQCLCNLLAPVVTNQFNRVSDKEVS
jgi:hypothetical protein